MHTTGPSFFRSFILLLFLFLVSISKIYAQEKVPVSFGKISVEDFNISSSLIDVNTSAVIIADVGITSFEGNAKGWFTYIFKKKKRIKILNKKAFDLATVQILLYQNDESIEKAENITAVCYNLENDKVIATKLESKNVYEEKADKNYLYKKFTLPAVKEGSIIEYSYTIKSEFEYNLPAWEFQSDEHPTLWSEYNVEIPGLLGYMSSRQGYHKFYINTSAEGQKAYNIKRQVSGGLVATEESFTVSSTTIIHRWIMKDVPGFKIENYISSSRNFIDKIVFQLFQTYDGQSYHPVTNSWKKVTDELMGRDDFGLPLTEPNEWMDDILKTVADATDDELLTAKKIYSYVQKNYTCTDHYDKYIKTTLKDVAKKKSGTVGEINLLLIALLKHKKIQAFPVLLSTRDFGRNKPNYPLMQKLNYVVCKTNIGANDFYLDATQPFLSFGNLPLECYNGHARVISEDTAAVYFLTDSIKEARSTIMQIINADKGQIVGTFNQNMGFYESLDTKNAIAKIALENYKTSIKQMYPEEIQVHDIEVKSFQTPDDLISVKFDFNLKSFENADLVYFNPMMGEGIKTNPFAAAERIYPVEMPYASEKVYTLNMEIPTGFKVDEVPKSVIIKLNGDEGFFEYLLRVEVNAIQMRSRIVLKKTDFASDEYQTLRDFYAQIVKKEAEQIVFKKIK